MWKLIPAAVAVVASLGMSTGAGGARSGERTPGAVGATGAGGSGCAIWLAPHARFAGEFATIEDYIDRRMRAANAATPKKATRAKPKKASQPPRRR